MVREPTSPGQLSRPVRPTLSREYIVATALALVDRGGAEGLSMRKLGGEVGVDPMAIYHYFPNKAALFDGIVEALHAEMDLASLPATGSWRDQLLGHSARLRQVLRRHPHAVSIFATRPVPVAAVLASGERGLVVLRAAGFPPRLAVTMTSCLREFTIGHVLAEVGEPIGGPAASTEEQARIFMSGQYPTLAEAIAGGYDPDEHFALGVGALLDGFAHLRHDYSPST